MAPYVICRCRAEGKGSPGDSNNFNNYSSGDAGLILDIRKFLSLIKKPNTCICSGNDHFTVSPQIPYSFDFQIRHLICSSLLRAPQQHNIDQPKHTIICEYAQYCDPYCCVCNVITNIHFRGWSVLPTYTALLHLIALLPLLPRLWAGIALHIWGYRCKEKWVKVQI